MDSWAGVRRVAMALLVMIAVSPPCLAKGTAYVDPFDPAVAASAQTVVGQNSKAPSLRVVLAGASAASVKALADRANLMARWLNPKSAIDPYDPAHLKEDLNRVLGSAFGKIEYVYWNAPESATRVDFVLTLEIGVVVGQHSFAQNQVELSGTLSASNAAGSEKLAGLGRSKVGFPAFITNFDTARTEAFDQFGQSLSGSRLIASYKPGRAALPSSQAAAQDASGNASPGFGESSGPTKPLGLYAIDSDIPFNVLDSVYFEPASGKLALIGHRDGRFTGPAIPYLQYLATLLENPKPEFSLAWTPDSAERVDALLASELTQQESDAQATRLAAMVDASGTVTHVGELMLPALGIYPIKDNRAPGDMGVTVESINGGRVVLMSVKPGSAADKAGLKPIDFISAVSPGRPVFFQSEFARQVRFAGAGSRIQVTYQRDNGAFQTTEVTLDAADDADPWRTVNRYDLISLMYRGAGDPQPAEVVDAFEVFNAMTTQNEQKAGWLPYAELMRSMGMSDDFEHIQQIGNGGAPPYQDAYDFGLKFARQLDSIFHLAGNPLQQYYENQVAQSHDPAGTLSLVMNQFDTYLTPKVSELIGGLVSRPGAGFQIPPELVEDEYHIHPEMTPEYLGVPAHSLLAKLMLDSDYLCKRLSNQQDLKNKIPGYQTMVEYQVNHPTESRPAHSAERVWTSVANVDAAQSGDGTTLALRNATMRFNIRQTGTALQHQDLTGDPGGGYDDVLTGLYDQFEQQFPTLHELREAAKLATASIWLQQKQPAFQLPADGRVTWNGPQTVPGLVYIYLTTNLQQQNRIFKIAEGGVSIEPPHVIPIDPSVVDLRRSPGFATLFVRPDSAAAPSWVAPIQNGAQAQQALVLDTHAGVFGTKVSSPARAQSEPAGGKGTDTSANHQLNSIAAGSASLGNASSDASASSGGHLGFDTVAKDAGAIDASHVAAPPAGDDTLVIPEDMLGDPDVLKLVDYKKQARQAHAAAAAAQASYDAEKSRDPASGQLALLQTKTRQAQDQAGNLDNMVKFEKTEIKRKISFAPVDTGVPAQPQVPPPATKTPAP